MRKGCRWACRPATAIYATSLWPSPALSSTRGRCGRGQMTPVPDASATDCLAGLVACRPSTPLEAVLTGPLRSRTKIQLFFTTRRKKRVLALVNNMMNNALAFPYPTTPLEFVGQALRIGERKVSSTQWIRTNLLSRLSSVFFLLESARSRRNPANTQNHRSLPLLFWWRIVFKNWRSQSRTSYSGTAKPGLAATIDSDKYSNSYFACYSGKRSATEACYVMLSELQDH